ncbi:Fe-S oxidoreductase [Clostridiales bacterium PH28_bin88]|nr:Fe-S oxidoreductase [Clostridiales bacterium PH28_bin88]
MVTLAINRGCLVAGVEPGSAASDAGIEPGDLILSINGEPLEDFIDYRYLCAEEFVQVDLLKATGERWTVAIEKDVDEDLGVSFSTTTFDGIRQCGNRCIFCFVDQMPAGMRESLYVKDDDYRHSFLHGNFITLTNLRDRDIERIRSLKLSPLYISVHTTNPSLREQMMRHPAAGRIMEQMRLLVEAGIQLHTQIVLCPGINDGTELDRTISQLADLWPQVLSIAVVPVGLTAHRRELYPLQGYSPQAARQVLKQVSQHQQELLERLGSRLVYAADEFYLHAGLPIPGVETYEDFPQMENGVGLVRKFLDDYDKIKRKLPRRLPRSREVGVVTGVSAAKIMLTILDELNKYVKGLRVQAAVVENRFFGPTVTVAGLLTGADLLRALDSAFPRNTPVLIPEVMVKAGEDLLLDGYRVNEVAGHLGLDLQVVPADARALVASVLGQAL